MIKKGFKRAFMGVASVALIASMLLGETSMVNAAATTTSYYLSELTGLPISTTLQNQRPIAVMVDNEKVALQHYGTSEADIVYEMMNSTANKRITRLMCIYKDYNNIPYIGSIRSVRPTNVILSGEYNAILVHDGGPFYINSYLQKSYADNLSAGFTRVNNGKRTEFTEYVKAGEAAKRIKAAGYSSTYTDEYKTTFNPGATHFNFNTTETLLSQTYANIPQAGVSSCTSIDLSGAFWHNSSKLVYNANTMTYDYYEYGSIHKDAEDSKVLTFKNVILENVNFVQYDSNGYMLYYVCDTRTGYYITDTQVIPIVWSKADEYSNTKYYDATGNEIKLNPGKTYIGLIPSDTWSAITLQ